MESPRLPRFKRARGVVPIQLTDRDRDIIRLIHQHRFLRSSHVIALINASPQSLSRRLQLLYHHGYLERPRIQLEYYHHGGSRHIIYGLGNKGAALLKQKCGPSVRWGEKNRSVGRIYLEHALLVSDVIVAMELGCRNVDGVHLLGSNEFPHVQRSFKWHVNIGGGIKLGIIPDRVFGLEYTNNAGSVERAYFFLEADRGTMPVMRRSLVQTSFYRKLLAYEATWSQGLHRSQFGFHRFRVLTVTTSPERVKSLINACSQLERGHGLFLFGDCSALDQVFSPVWQTVRQSGVSLLS